MLKEIIGDLFDEEHKFDVILHGCNCFHTMGAGVAGIISRKFPEAYTADIGTAFGDKNKLGKISWFKTTKKINEYNPLIVNCYTQFEPGKTFEEQALIKCLKKVKKDFGHLKIGLPEIGCGIDGGDWNRVKAIIKKQLMGVDCTVVSLKK